MKWFIAVTLLSALTGCAPSNAQLISYWKSDLAQMDTMAANVQKGNITLDDFRWYIKGRQDILEMIEGKN